MMISALLHCPAAYAALTLLIGGVWVFHGLYIKLLGGISCEQ